MKTIKIDKNSRIKLDEFNYILEYRIPKGDFGEKKGIGFKWELGGYFPTLEVLAQDYVSNAPLRLKSSITTLKEVVSIIQSAEKRITKLIT